MENLSDLDSTLNHERSIAKRNLQDIGKITHLYSPGERGHVVLEIGRSTWFNSAHSA
jgi:hypothetical protein